MRVGGRLGLREVPVFEVGQLQLVGGLDSLVGLRSDFIEASELILDLYQLRASGLELSL
jgi:hypothetical protein